MESFRNGKRFDVAECVLGNLHGEQRVKLDLFREMKETLMFPVLQDSTRTTKITDNGRKHANNTDEME